MGWHERGKSRGPWGQSPQPSTLLFLAFVGLGVASSCLTLFRIACFPFQRGFDDKLALPIVVADHMRTITDGQPSVEKLMHDHRTANQRVPPFGLLQLEYVMVDNDRVVAIH